MRSFLHCVWTGASFPYGLRRFVRTWVPYLRHCHSDFQVVVWLTHDSYQAASDFLLKGGLGDSIDQKGWNKIFPNIDILFNTAKLGFNKFYIGMIEPLLAK